MKIYRVKQPIEALHKVDDQTHLAIKVHAGWRSDNTVLQARYFSSFRTMIVERSILGDLFHANRRLINANTYL